MSPQQRCVAEAFSRAARMMDAEVELEELEREDDIPEPERWRPAEPEEDTAEIEADVTSNDPEVRRANYAAMMTNVLFQAASTHENQMRPNVSDEHGVSEHKAALKALNEQIGELGGSRQEPGERSRRPMTGWGGCCVEHPELGEIEVNEPMAGGTHKKALLSQMHIRTQPWQIGKAIHHRQARQPIRDQIRGRREGPDEPAHCKRIGAGPLRCHPLFQRVPLPPTALYPLLLPLPLTALSSSTAYSRAPTNTYPKT